jgi:hypothetical protein
MKVEIAKQEIESRIFTIRGMQVMLDRDLACLYLVTTKVLNQAVKRNILRFPEDFMFQLTTIEKIELVTNCDRLEKLKHSTALPFVFTEHGVAMLSSVLRSEAAIEINISIMRTFMQFRNDIKSGKILLQRLSNAEKMLIEHSVKINLLISNQDEKKHQTGIFFNDQIFDSYVFVCELVQKAKKSIVLIDNYIDESVLVQLSKRNHGTISIIYTKTISPQLQLDITKHNSQYPPIIIKTIKNVHDRFLIIDDKELYHIGASLKDLGKKWFAFSRIDSLLPEVRKRL